MLGKTQDVANSDVQTVDIRADKQNDQTGLDIQDQDDGVVRMHVKYCTGWSYKGTLVQIQQYIRNKFAEQRANYDMGDGGSVDSMPKLEITGENYEVGGINAFLSAMIGHLRIAFFIVLFVGDAVFTPFGGL